MKRLMKSFAALNIALFLAGTIVMPLSVYADDGDTTGQDSGTEPAGNSGENDPLRAPGGSQDNPVSVSVDSGEETVITVKEDRDASNSDGYAVSVDAKNGYTANVEVTGNVTGKAGVLAYAGENSAVNVNVGTGGEDVEAEMIGISNGFPLGVVYANAKVNVTAGGSVTATGSSSDFGAGVAVATAGDDSSTTIDVKKDIEGYYAGIYVNSVNGGRSSVHAGGSVTTKEGSAILISNAADTSGETTIVVGENVTGIEAGIVDEDYRSSSFNTVIIEGTLSSSDGAPVVFDADTSKEGDPSNLNLTVWKIEPIDGLIAAKRDASGNLTQNDQTSEFEKNINYIIKIEPNDKISFSAEKEGGAESVTAKVNETTYTYNVANENEKVILKIDGIADGYILKAAYNGEGKEVPLQKDKNGNYYIVVKRGGGIYLSVVAEKAESDDDARDTTYIAPPEEYFLSLAEPAELEVSDGRIRRIPKTADTDDRRFWTILLLAMMGTAFASSVILIRTE